MAFSPFVTISGVVAKLLQNATATVDGNATDSRVRLGKYGEILTPFAAPTRHQLVEEGSYMIATNPTVSTGQTQVAAQTSFSDTSFGAGFYLQNNEATGGKTLWLDYVKMIATAAATSTTSVHYAAIVDTARSITANNMLAITPVNPNGALGNIITPTLLWQNSASASTLVASSGAKRLVARGALGGLNIAGDELVVVFGSTDVGAHAGLTAAESAAPSRRVSNSPAIGIAPGQCCTFTMWAIGSSASWNPEFELGMFAR
jgi:hypothetical protein